jgi:ATP-dependent DNA helicase RecQ
MKLVIDSKGSVSGSLHLKVSGFSVELSDIPASGKVAVIDDSGNVSIEVLQVEDTFVEKPLKEVQQPEPSSEAVPEVLDISSNLLFQKLAVLRRQIAKEERLPPYIILHDASLKDMVLKLPSDLEAMKDISGVGQAKLEKYGGRFVDAIKAYLAESV